MPPFNNMDASENMARAALLLPMGYCEVDLLYRGFDIEHLSASGPWSFACALKQ